MRRIVCTAAFLAFSAGLVAGLAGCGSTTSGTRPAATGSVRAVSGTEVIRAEITGAKAAKYIGSPGSAAIIFPEVTFTGPVVTRLAPFTLGGKGSRHTFVTPAGNLAVTHARDKKQQASPVVTGQAGRVCWFRFVAEKGTWTAVPGRSTGEFAGATGTGIYTLTFTVKADLLPGKTKCTPNNTGNPLAKGASIVFVASGPLTVR